MKKTITFIILSLSISTSFANSMAPAAGLYKCKYYFEDYSQNLKIYWSEWRDTKEEAKLEARNKCKVASDSQWGSTCTFWNCRVSR